MTYLPMTYLPMTDLPRRLFNPIQATLAAVVFSASLISLAPVAWADSGCYVVTEDGQLYDLVELCTVSTSRGEPVLQTGDVQVTLRWATDDDLDLFVVDPAGDVVNYYNPAVPSGGALDVDANAFCEDPGYSPVENIYWPTGGAPAGNYSAYVVLSIPCGETVDPVNYSISILSQGQIQTYEGVSVAGGGAETTYPFTVTSPAIGE